ncbi:MAG: DUF4259 domain-containing protein [Eubacteriales bacterium]|nr:DUF4259 domain-containing protein [Eubacteriales bacterium]
MGAWGWGPLENDTASDLMLDLAEVSSGQVHQIVTGLVEGASGFIDASRGEALVAFAYWITEGEDAASVSTIMRQKLSGLLDRVLDEEESELAQLWLVADKDEYREWVGSVRQLQGKLK